MASQATLHITPAGGGTWAVKTGEDAPASSVHPTRAQAIAGAWDLLKDRDGAEVVIQDEDGRARSSLIIRLVDDGDDPAARAEAMRITPSVARLKAGMYRRLPVEGADIEADPADLY